MTAVVADLNVAVTVVFDIVLCAIAILHSMASTINAISTRLLLRDNKYESGIAPSYAKQSQAIDLSVCDTLLVGYTVDVRLRTLTAITCEMQCSSHNLLASMLQDRVGELSNVGTMRHKHIIPRTRPMTILESSHGLLTCSA